MLNQFTGYSTKTLERELAKLSKALADFYADEDAGGGGSPTEAVREQIEDLEAEIARRRSLQNATLST